MKNQIADSKLKVPVVQKIEVDNRLVSKLNQKIERMNKQLEKIKADKAEDLDMLNFLMAENERLMVYVHEAINSDGQNTIKRILRKAVRVYSQLPDADEMDRCLYRVDGF